MKRNLQCLSRNSALILTILIKKNIVTFYYRIFNLQHSFKTLILNFLWLKFNVYVISNIGVSKLIRKLLINILYYNENYDNKKPKIIIFRISYLSNKYKWKSGKNLIIYSLIIYSSILMINDKTAMISLLSNVFRFRFIIDEKNIIYVRKWTYDRVFTEL